MFQYQKLRNKKHFSKNIFSSDKKKKVGDRNENLTSRQTRYIAAPSTVDQECHENGRKKYDVNTALFVRCSVHLRPDDLHLGHFKNAQESMGRQFIELAVDVMTYRFENRCAMLLWVEK